MLESRRAERYATGFFVGREIGGREKWCFVRAIFEESDSGQDALTTVWGETP